MDGVDVSGVRTPFPCTCPSPCLGCLELHQSLYAINECLTKTKTKTMMMVLSSSLGDRSYAVQASAVPSSWKRSLGRAAVPQQPAFEKWLTVCAGRHQNAHCLVLSAPFMQHAPELSCHPLRQTRLLTELGEPRASQHGRANQRGSSQKRCKNQRASGSGKPYMLPLEMQTMLLRKRSRRCSRITWGQRTMSRRSWPSSICGGRIPDVHGRAMGDTVTLDMVRRRVTRLDRNVR